MIFFMTRERDFSKAAERCLLMPLTVQRVEEKKREFLEFICVPKCLQYVRLSKSVLGIERVKKTRRMLEQPKVGYLLSIRAHMGYIFVETLLIWSKSHSDLSHWPSHCKKTSQCPSVNWEH